ncbi:MAG: AmmeMemoRadiSam system radical SAM enzyme [Lachnospiraceae bacterium]|nr:AmmeMemoRadiSam system radical SAM enzyme [Lachnospiraceae bacterium]
MTERCNVCFAHCYIPEGKTGRCGARTNVDGKIVPTGYGKLTSLALDPIEKKPLRRFLPGSSILSAGSYGCNLMCPFCQNHSISMARPGKGLSVEYWEPERLVQLAASLKERGNIGIAFTYNEPMINHEYILDCAKLAKEEGLKIVLVTNGTAEKEILDEVLPFVDAMNIDIKGFTEEYYRDFVKGDLGQVKQFIEAAAKACHVELTTLIIPEKNDSESDMRRLCSWISSLESRDAVPLHISRFFPAYKMSDSYPTPVRTVYHLKDVAEEYLEYVYTGNC